jgi:hypothetical protein
VQIHCVGGNRNVQWHLWHASCVCIFDMKFFHHFVLSSAIRRPGLLITKGLRHPRLYCSSEICGLLLNSVVVAFLNSETVCQSDGILSMSVNQSDARHENHVNQSILNSISSFRWWIRFNTCCGDTRPHQDMVSWDFSNNFFRSSDLVTCARVIRVHSVLLYTQID